MPNAATAASAIAAPAAAPPPAVQPAVPMDKIAALSLATRARIARRCSADERAVCSDMKRGRGRLVAALSPACRETLETALK